MSTRRRPSPEVEEILADMTLCQLDIMAERISGSPALLETSKAITAAQMHPDIEARVICKSVEDAVEALLILSGPTMKEFGGKFYISRRTLELPNGSAVVVKYEPSVTEPNP